MKIIDKIGSWFRGKDKIEPLTKKQPKTEAKQSVRRERNVMDDVPFAEVEHIRMTDCSLTEEIALMERLLKSRVLGSFEIKLIRALLTVDRGLLVDGTDLQLKALRSYYNLKLNEIFGK